MNAAKVLDCLLYTSPGYYENTFILKNISQKPLKNYRSLPLPSLQRLLPASPLVEAVNLSLIHI